MVSEGLDKVDEEWDKVFPIKPKEKETEKLKTEEQQSQEQKEFEEFEKWKESRKNDNVS